MHTVSIPIPEDMNQTATNAERPQTEKTVPQEALTQETTESPTEPTTVTEEVTAPVHSEPLEKADTVTGFATAEEQQAPPPKIMTAPSVQVTSAPTIPSETVSAKTDPATTEPEVQTTPLDLQEAMLSGTNYAASVYGTTADGSLDFTNSDYRFPGTLPGTCTQVELVRKVMDGVGYTFGQIMEQEGVTMEDTVLLTWKRTNDTYYDTLQDDAKVYSFGVDVVKKFAEGTGDYSKVQFKLRNDTDDYYVQAKLTDGVYYVTGHMANKVDGTVFTPDSKGHILVKGLENDTYKLKEVHTDSGYLLLLAAAAFAMVKAKKRK